MLIDSLSKWNDRQFADLEKWILASCGSVDVVVAWRRSLPTFSRRYVAWTANLSHTSLSCRRNVWKYPTVDDGRSLFCRCTASTIIFVLAFFCISFNSYFRAAQFTALVSNVPVTIACFVYMRYFVGLFVFFILVLVFCSLFVLCVCIYVCCVPIKDIGLSIYLLYRMTQASSSTDDDMMRVKVCIVIVV